MTMPTSALHPRCVIAALAIVLGALLGLHASSAVAKPIYVSVVGSDTVGTGSVGSPYATVQHAIGVAALGDRVDVGPGTFDGDVTMRNGVSLYGSGASLTTLEGTGEEPVITCVGVAAGTTISGLTITGGGAANGGGVYCDSSSPTISENTITGNWASYVGGGIGCMGSSPTIANNTISGNVAVADGGGIGCVMSSPAITGNTISDNVAQAGGGVYGDAASPIIAGNSITGNWSDGAGGGIGLFMASWSTIVNNTISENAAGTDGGGIKCGQGTQPTIINNTIWGNTADGAGGGIHRSASTVAPTITNCIIWGNGGDLVACSATYSCIESVGSATGLGNITTAPSFVATSTGDFRLKAGSRCIDAGTSEGAPTTDKDGRYRPQGSCDMGAYEYDSPIDPVYRFRNLRNGFYLWSIDPVEKDAIVSTLSGTWRLEGPAYTVNSVTNTAPLWRFLNLRGGFYLYSADPAEKDTIVRTLSSEWRLEGRAYNVSRASGRPVWRFRNKGDGTYLLSADPAEKDAIVRTLSATWQLEGPAFYIAP